MPPVELPLEIFEIILDLLPEEDESYIESLKSLSYTTAPYAACAQKKLFRRLEIRFEHANKPVQELVDILSSNSSIRTAICEILLVNIFGSTRSERVEEETALIADLFDAMDSPECTQLTLEHICRDSMSRQKIVPLIPTTFRSLSHLMITKGPSVDLCVVNQITTIKCLELLSVSIERNYWHKNFNKTGDIVPALERLAIIDVEYATCGAPMPIFGLSGIFDLRGLKELAMQVAANQGDTLLDELAPICGDSLTSLSFHVGQYRLRHLCGWRSLRHFKAVRRLDIYFPHSLQARVDDWYGGIDPRMEVFEEFWPPISLEVLSFRFKWCESVSWFDGPSGWAASQVQIMDRKIGIYFQSRWRHLRSVTFQMMFEKKALKDQEAHKFELRDSDAGNMRQHGVILSVLPKQMITRPEWPHYA